MADNSAGTTGNITPYTNTLLNTHTLNFYNSGTIKLENHRNPATMKLRRNIKSINNSFSVGKDRNSL